MSTTYILYNPYADNGNCKAETEKLQNNYNGAVLINMSRVNNYKVFFDGLEADAAVIICGGDGTLNRFINETGGLAIKTPIYYFPAGSGNDFARDLGHNRQDSPNFSINRYLEKLPTVTANGRTWRFLNGVGYGIDGYCCEAGDRLREQNRKRNRSGPVNYTAIAAKGLIFHFHPRNAEVTVDGERHTYKSVWLAPTMLGRYYGGGMMPAPNQNRLRQDGKVSLMVFHDAGKFRTLMIFPSIFSGRHVRYKKHVSILEGREITVVFDRPTPLQIDGETVRGVRSYTVTAPREADGCPALVAEARRGATLAG